MLQHATATRYASKALAAHVSTLQSEALVLQYQRQFFEAELQRLKARPGFSRRQQQRQPGGDSTQPCQDVYAHMVSPNANLTYEVLGTQLHARMSAPEGACCFVLGRPWCDHVTHTHTYTPSLPTSHCPAVVLPVQQAPEAGLVASWDAEDQQPATAGAFSVAPAACWLVTEEHSFARDCEIGGSSFSSSERQADDASAEHSQRQQPGLQTLVGACNTHGGSDVSSALNG